MKKIFDSQKAKYLLYTVGFIFLLMFIYYSKWTYDQDIKSGAIIKVVPDHGVYKGKKVVIYKTSRNIMIGEIDIDELSPNPSGKIYVKKDIWSMEDGFIFYSIREANLQEIAFYREYFPEEKISKKE